MARRNPLKESHPDTDTLPGEGLAVSQAEERRKQFSYHLPESLGLEIKVQAMRRGINTYDLVEQILSNWLSQSGNRRT